MKDKTFDPKTIHRQLKEVGPWSFFFLLEIAFKHYYPWYAGLYQMNGSSAIGSISKHEPKPERLIKRFQKEVGYHTLYESFPEGYVNQW